MNVDPRRTGLSWGGCHAPYQVTPVIPDGGGRHNDLRSGTFADKQTKSLSRLDGGEGREVCLLEGDEAAGELE